MPEPPFLELSYYVPPSSAGDAFASIVPSSMEVAGVRKTSIPGLIGISKTDEEIELINGAILVLRGDGSNFCGPEREQSARLKKLGQRTQRRFVEVADSISCAYAAILVEYSLETPAELRRDPRSLAFRDFFLKRSAFSGSAIRAVLEEANGAYVADTATGTYVSMSAEFNPEGRSILDEDAQWRSSRISALVARGLAQ